MTRIPFKCARWGAQHACLGIALFIITTTLLCAEPGADLVQIQPPPNFEGPIAATPGAGTHIDAYVHRIPGSDRSTLLQVTTYDFGSKLEGVPKSELGDGAEKYLMQFLGGIERARAEFHAAKPTRTALGGVPAARVEWTGLARGQAMSGVMYCVIVDTVVVSFHTQGFDDSPVEDRKAALHSIEAVTFRSKHSAPADAR